MVSGTRGQALPSLEAAEPYSPQRPGALAQFGRRLLKDPAACIGGGIILGVVLLAIIGPWIAPYEPTDQNLSRRLAPVGSDGFILGTDQLGRDILSRLLYGARISLIIALVPLTASVAFGVALGLVSGYYGKLLDMITGRVFDVLLAFPAILLAIGIVAALGPGMINAMLAIIVIAIPENARIVRGIVLTLKELEYVEAARVLGASNRRIMWRHILPNSLPSIIVFTSLNLGRMIIFAAGLSFLGLGPQPPTAEWGSMLAQGRTVLPIAPHVATIPGLAIFTVVLGANLFGDGLRDILDPRLRNT
jgi:peptide/nickel transport system permease protein